jgi:hypothetical protein
MRTLLVAGFLCRASWGLCRLCSQQVGLDTTGSRALTCSCWSIRLVGGAAYVTVARSLICTGWGLDHQAGHLQESCSCVAVIVLLLSLVEIMCKPAGHILRQGVPTDSQ